MERTVLARRLLHRRPGLVGSADVALAGRCAAAGARDARRHPFAVGQRDIRAKDGGPLGAEGLGDGAADAVAGAGHDGGPVREFTLPHIWTSIAY